MSPQLLNPAPPQLLRGGVVRLVQLPAETGETLFQFLAPTGNLCGAGISAQHLVNQRLFVQRRICALGLIHLVVVILFHQQGFDGVEEPNAVPPG